MIFIPSHSVFGVHIPNVETHKNNHLLKAVFVCVILKRVLV